MQTHFLKTSMIPKCLCVLSKDLPKNIQVQKIIFISFGEDKANFERICFKFKKKTFTVCEIYLHCYTMTHEVFTIEMTFTFSEYSKIKQIAIYIFRNSRLLCTAILWQSGF